MAESERSEQRGVRASKASGGGGAAGRPRIVAEGDGLRVLIYILPPNLRVKPVASQPSKHENLSMLLAFGSLEHQLFVSSIAC